MSEIVLDPLKKVSQGHVESFKSRLTALRITGGRTHERARVDDCPLHPLDGRREALNRKRVVIHNTPLIYSTSVGLLTPLPSRRSPENRTALRGLKCPKGPLYPTAPFRRASLTFHSRFLADCQCFAPSLHGGGKPSKWPNSNTPLEAASSGKRKRALRSEEHTS